MTSDECIGTKQDVKEGETVELKRQLSLLSAANLIISCVIGIGIFVSPSAALRYSGSVGLSLVIWVLSGILSLLGSLVYAELALLVPRSGSSYIYCMEAFGSLNKFWGPLPSFIYSFVYVFLACPIAGATAMLISAEYLMQFIMYFICIDDTDYIVYAKKMIALMEICTVTYINCTSVKLYARVQNVLVLCKIAICLLIICCGVYQLSEGNLGSLTNGFEGSNFSPKNIALALYSGLYAYGGNVIVTMVTQEIKKPEVNILRSMLIAIVFVTITYLCMIVSYLTTLSVSEMTSGAAVATLFAEKIYAPFMWIISLGVAISAFGGILAIQFGISRLSYVASENGHSIKLLSFIHIRRMTPVPSIVIQCIIACVVVLVSDIFTSIEFTSFVIAFCDIFSIVALFILRKKNKNAKTLFRVPTWIVIISLFERVFLVIAPMTASLEVKYLIAIGIIILLFFVYWGLIYRKVEVKFMKKLTHAGQIFFEVVPQENKTM